MQTQKFCGALIALLVSVVALLRGTAEAGFESIEAVFDAAYDEGILAPVEIELWSRAFASFVRVPHHGHMKLFCNADNRGALAEPGTRSATLAMLRAAGLHPTNLCLEISEHHSLHKHGVTPGMTDGLSHDRIVACLVCWFRRDSVPSIGRVILPRATRGISILLSGRCG